MGVYSKHTIGVETVYTSKGGRVVQKQIKTFKQLANGSKEVQTRTRDMTKENSKLEKTSRSVTKGFRRFQMEQLGVMFAGMALNRTMANLNATAREWVGMSELMSTMMGVVMLPATMDLLNFGVLPLFDALTSLPEGAQRAIGYVVTSLESLGGVMMVGGQLMLGLDSTTNMLHKMGGVSGIAGKLRGVSKSLKGIAKYAAAGILISVAIKDLGEDQAIAALGMGLAAAGIFIGGPAGIAMMSVGVVLKLAGDEDFLVGVIKTMLKVGRTVNSIIKEAVVSAFTMRDFNVENIDGLANVGRAFGRAIEEIKMEEAERGDIVGVLFPESSMDALFEQMDELDRMHDANIISENEYNSKMDAVVAEKEALQARYIAASKMALDSAKEKSKEPRAPTPELSTFGKFATNPVASMLNLFSGKGFTNTLTGMATGGKVRSTGRYYLHEGEEVSSKNDVSSGTSMNVTYNVTVSDKREFEQMLKANNEKLTADVRRMSKL